jgi:hypothetical protein
LGRAALRWEQQEQLVSNHHRTELWGRKVTDVKSTTLGKEEIVVRL